MSDTGEVPLVVAYSDPQDIRAAAAGRRGGG